LTIIPRARACTELAVALPALRSFSEGGSEAEGVVEWAQGRLRKRISPVDSCWSLPRTEFTPHRDAGMRGRNDKHQESNFSSLVGTLAHFSSLLTNEHPASRIQLSISLGKSVPIRGYLLLNYQCESVSIRVLKKQCQFFLKNSLSSLWLKKVFFVHFFVDIVCIYVKIPVC